MTWHEAVLSALKRYVERHKKREIVRAEFLADELDNIIRDTNSLGKTPHQTLSRTLQELRDAGYLDFVNNDGIYFFKEGDGSKDQFSFVSGQVYSRRALHARFKGQERGGICTPAQFPVVLIFTGKSGTKYGYEDGWTSRNTFMYAGEGQAGDMAWVRGNKAIRDHLQDEKELHLFKIVSNGKVEYVSKMVCIGHERRTGIDKTGKQREVIVFELLPYEHITQKDGQLRNRKKEKARLEDSAKDATFQQEILYASEQSLPTGPLAPNAPVRDSGRIIWPRNPGIAKRRFAEAGYACEFEPSHATFTSQVTKKPYVEAHHLIPISKQLDFPNASLDVPENILVLCPICHRKFHHAISGEQIALLERFYGLKIEGLLSRGIDVSMAQLIEFYS